MFHFGSIATRSRNLFFERVHCERSSNAIFPTDARFALKYRPEIDGLRAVAVIPVVLFHAGFEPFAGGFLGVDIFFVISGYLITTLIVQEIKDGSFSLSSFYERRARRILPALLVMMVSTTVIGYFVLMPDEYKNLGQSLVATMLFSNNILLGITSGYWDLASQFKPLIHTWSLGVEEQFYLIFPIFMLAISKYCPARFIWAIAIMAVISYVTFYSVNAISPRWAFYILPARAWELLIGSVAAFIVSRDSKQALALCRWPLTAYSGFLVMIFAIAMYTPAGNGIGQYNIAITIGTMLVIVGTASSSKLRDLLSSRALVSVGLISYSLYLWHQPMYSFLRALSSSRPDEMYYVAALGLAFLLSIASWKYVEKPFREKGRVQLHSFIILVSTSSILLIAFGVLLDRTYGLPGRAFGAEVRVEDMDKRIYNERAYKFKKHGFEHRDKKKILVIGTSFARDFTNIIVENFNVRDIELVYSDDLKECIVSAGNVHSKEYFSAADVIVFAGGGYSRNCLDEDLDYAKSYGKRIYYVGSKEFGYNLNWLILKDPSGRANKYNKISPDLILVDQIMKRDIPQGMYISLIGPLIVDGAIPVTDEKGNMLSTDRAHLTKYGALYFGRKVVKHTKFAKEFDL